MARLALREVLLATLDQADAAGYRGYSKFDGLHSPVTRTLSFGWWPLRLMWSQAVMRAPVNPRPLLLTETGVNPEAPALFARANLDARGTGGEAPCSERARACLESLLERDSNREGAYHGSCWGYHHPWQNTGFYQPAGFPNCYLTAIAGGALVHGYRVLGEQRYLEAARSAVDFIRKDLAVFHEDREEKCITYVPTMRTELVVININALAAAFLAEVGAETGEPSLRAEARKLMTFVARRQTPEGAWFYTTKPGQSLVRHDNYHTGMILDALATYATATGDDAFASHYTAGLDFYRSRLFLDDGAPRWTSDRIYPHDVHGSGQGTLSFASAGELSTATRIAEWAVAHFYRGGGRFSYQRGRLWHKRFTLLHWCNGWMARGLAALLAAPPERA